MISLDSQIAWWQIIAQTTADERAEASIQQYDNPDPAEAYLVLNSWTLQILDMDCQMLKLHSIYKHTVSVISTPDKTDTHLQMASSRFCQRWYRRSWHRLPLSLQSSSHLPSNWKGKTWSWGPVQSCGSAFRWVLTAVKLVQSLWSMSRNVGRLVFWQGAEA